jgi:hypothetical protein
LLSGTRAASVGIQHRQIAAIRHAAAELEELGLVRRVTLDVRLHALPPLFKLFIVNDADAFFGFDPIQRRSITIDGDQSSLVHHRPGWRARSVEPPGRPKCPKCPLLHSPAGPCAYQRPIFDAVLSGSAGLGSAQLTEGGQRHPAPARPGSS